MDEILDMSELVEKGQAKEIPPLWFIAAVDHRGDAWIMDATPWLYDYDVIIETLAEDNGVIVPKGLRVGLYRVTDVTVREVGRNDDPDIMITGTWTPEGYGNTHLLYETGDADAPDVIKDRNGEVVLGLCRRCGAGEVELGQKTCADRLHEALTELQDVVAKAADGMTA